MKDGPGVFIKATSESYKITMKAKLQECKKYGQSTGERTTIAQAKRERRTSISSSQEPFPVSISSYNMNHHQSPSLPHKSHLQPLYDLAQEPSSISFSFPQSYHQSTPLFPNPMILQPPSSSSVLFKNHHSNFTCWWESFLLPRENGLQHCNW